MRRRTTTVAGIVAVVAACAPLAACLLDLPTPIVNDDAGFDGSSPDTGLPDGFVPPDGMSPDGSMIDGGGMDVINPPMDGGCDGPCVFLTFNNIEPRMIETDNTNLVYALGSDVIEQRTISTKAQLTLIQNQADFVNDLRVRNGFAYFTSSGTKVSRVPINGGNRLNYTTNGANIDSVDADNTYVWFTVNAGGGGGIVRCMLGAPCGSINPLLSFTNPRHLLVDGNIAYWDTNANNIYYCSTPGCASGQSGMGFGVQRFAFDTTSVYWVDGSSVYKESKGSMSNMVIVNGVNGGTNGFAIRTDGTNVYWLTKSGNVGALRRCAISGCTNKMADTLASNLANPTSLTLTASEVFFTTQGDDTIWRVPK